MDQLMGKLLRDLTQVLQWFMRQPLYIKAAVVVPAMIVHAVLFVVGERNRGSTLARETST